MAIKDVLGRIRSVWGRERQNIEQAQQLVKGQAQPMGFDTFSIYGRYGLEPLQDYLRIEQELLTRYLDYSEMENYPELSVAFDIWADEATQPDVLTGRVMWIESDDVQIKKLLQDLLDSTLQMDEEIWSIARMLVKYGNHFEEILPTPNGVVGTNSLPPETVRRYEAGTGLLIGFAQDPRGVFGITVDDVDKVLRGEQAAPLGMQVFEPWQMVHFRLVSKSRPSTYGVSVLEPARWIWRRLLLLEDAVLIYRLTRTPTRWLFYIDVGKLPPTQALGQIRKIKNEFTKQKFVNEKGNVDLRFNVLSSDENLFLPVVDGKRTTEVDLMATPEWQVTDDVEYFLKKLYTAIKIPRAYLAAEEGARARLLSLQDLQLARSVMRVQRELRAGVRKICKVHLAALGIDPEKVNFDVFMTIPSWAYELSQLEVRNAKVEFAERVRGYLSERATMKAIFGFSDDEIEALRAEREEEAMRAAELGVEAPPPEKSKRIRSSEGSMMDLPGSSRFLPPEEGDNARNYALIVEQLKTLAANDKEIAKRLEDLKSSGREMRSSMFYKTHGGRSKVVPSLGVPSPGRGNGR